MLLVIVDQVYVHSVSAIEAPDDSPIGANGDCPESAQIALELTQAKSGQVHILQAVGTFQDSKDVLNLRQHVRLVPVRHATFGIRATDL
jgi:hypothetical protein